MKCFLVSSAVTFVPGNYEDLVLGVADDPHVQGLILVENRDGKVLAQACALILSGAAPMLGFQLLVNFLGSSTRRKREAYLSRGKKFFLVKDINDPAVVEMVRAEQVDLLLNARTRAFFRKKILAAPRLGCLNIHHGLLPNQRGLMCDFWAHLEKTPFGFSIHEMTSRLDAGSLFKVQEVQTDRQSYLRSVQAAACAEAPAVSEVLRQLAENSATGLHGEPNLETEKTIYRRNPGLKDFYKLRLRGTTI